MPKPVQLGVPCDICGKDEHWDNRTSKKNAKAPDWVCANKECAGKDGFKFGRWEKDRAKWDKAAKTGPTKAQNEPQGGRITGDDTTPDERGEKVFSWQALTYTYGKLYAAVYATVIKHSLPNEPIDHSVVQAGVATLLIQGEKAHIPLLHPRPKAKEVVQAPPKKAEDFKQMPEGLEPEDFDELPF